MTDCFLNVQKAWSVVLETLKLNNLDSNVHNFNFHQRLGENSLRDISNHACFLLLFLSQSCSQLFYRLVLWLCMGKGAGFTKMTLT